MSIIFIILLLFCCAMFVSALQSEYGIKPSAVNETSEVADPEIFEHSIVIKHPACGFTSADWEKFDENKYISIITIWTWCNEMFGRDNYTWHDGVFYFRHDRDRTMFALRWT